MTVKRGSRSVLHITVETTRIMIFQYSDLDGTTIETAIQISKSKTKGKTFVSLPLADHQADKVTMRSSEFSRQN
jgi:hypothetical protein